MQSWQRGGTGSLLRGDSDGGLRGVDLSQAGCFHAPGERRERLCPRHPANGALRPRRPDSPYKSCAAFSASAQQRNSDLRGSWRCKRKRGQRLGQSCPAMRPAEKAGSCALYGETTPRPVSRFRQCLRHRQRGRSLGEVRSQAGVWERVTDGSGDHRTGVVLHGSGTKFGGRSAKVLKSPSQRARARRGGRDWPAESCGEV
jgi:hypothetical protein